MAQTYAQIQKQIEQLQKQADALRSEEVTGVIERIKQAIAAYDLTADQLGFGSAQGSTSKGATSPTTKPATKTQAKTKSKGNGKAMFRDKDGKMWVGRGPRPLWLREALQAGHDLNEYRIGNRTRAKKNLVPLSSAGNSDAPAAAETAAAPAPSAKKATAPARKSSRTSYTNGDGKTWGGMGPKPAWLKDAIEAGKSLADFAH